MRTTIHCMVFLTIFGVAFTDSQNQFSSDTLVSLFKQYDKVVKPKTSKGPVNVGVSLYFEYIEWAKNKLDIAVYLRQTWTDPRFKLKSDVTRFSAEDVIKHMWKPNTFFVNALQPKVINIGLVDIDEIGAIYWSQDLQFTLPCPANSSNPTEVNCPLALESYSLLSKELVYTWIDKPVFSNVANVVRLLDTAEVKNKYPSGEYSGLNLNMKITIK